MTAPPFDVDAAETALADCGAGDGYAASDIAKQAIAEVRRLRADLADYRAHLGATSTAANHHANHAHDLAVERDWLLAEADDDTRERFARIRRTRTNDRPAYLTEGNR